MDGASEPSIRTLGAGALVLTGLVGAALVGALFAGDGSDTGGILPVGGAAVVLLAGAFLAVGVGRLSSPRLGRSGGVLVGTAVAVALWTGVTMAWSILPDRSWDSSNKTIAYVAFLGLGLVLAAAGGRAAARLAASLLALVIGAALVWALLTKAVPGLDPEGDRVARLREPVGYWNALALLADMALALGLWLGTSPGHRRRTRIAGGLLVYVAALALMLTLSRAGVVVAAVVLVLWLALSLERVESGLLLVASAAPALLIGAWAFTRPALTEDIATREDRVADGTILGVLVLVGAAVVAILIALGARRSLAAETRARAGRRLAVVASLCAVLAVAGLVFATTGVVSNDRDCAEVSNDPSRFGTLGSARLCWWEEAWNVFVGNSPEGAGAGTFEIARKRYRSDARSVVEPHSVPLQHLADGGIVGLVLFVTLVAAAAAVCIGALRRLHTPERGAAVALVALPIAYLGHALVDYNWNFLAVTAPTMVALGALAGAGRAPGSSRRRPLLVVVAVIVAATVVVSFSFPRLAEWMERDSTRAVVSNDLDLARDRALWARFFNPLAVEPLFALARVDEARGWPVTAERRYIQAVELQPRNPETWYTAGIFEFEVRENLCATYRYLNNAYTLDPAGSQWVAGGPLDVARDAVNAGGCAPGS
ncbi:MAG TPA: O-antigen ligase family protein [Gaiellaceae bacterium]|nr:O-antigen ligase family protein [Gaiellaceae bacterium]